MRSKLPTGNREVPILYGTKYGTQRQIEAIEYAAAERERQESLRHEKALEQRRKGSAKVARDLGSGAVTAEELMQPGHITPDTDRLDANDLDRTKMTWRVGDVDPRGDVDDYEDVQAAAWDPSLVSPELRDSLVPTAQGEMHPSALRVETVDEDEKSNETDDKAEA